MTVTQILCVLVCLICTLLTGYTCGYKRGMEQTYRLLTEALDEVHKTEMDMLGRDNDGSD